VNGADGDPPSPLSDPAFVAGLRPVASGVPGEAPDWPAADLEGVRPDGTPVVIGLDGMDRPLLLVFLASRCDGCAAFWEGLSAGTDPCLDEVVTVVVTKGPDGVDITDLAARGAGFTGEVVMGPRAWADYRVTGYPFLVLVDPTTRRILAETVGFGWSDVSATVRAGLEG
jgi:hypothetical protein